jgi:hypothetical protein
MTAILETARKYVRQGLSVIPVKADGSKAPLLAGWREFARTLPTDGKLVEWFGDGVGPRGVGVVGGEASGNLMVLDFENRDGYCAYTIWRESLPDDLRQLVDTLPTVATPSGGRHVWVRLAQAHAGCRLARFPDRRVKIEIRGNNHQVLAPGCPPECHKSGKPYTWLIPPEAALETHGELYPTVDLEVWIELVHSCSAHDECPEPEQARDAGVKDRDSIQESPGTDFNVRGTWQETGLFEAGWNWVKRESDQVGYLTRPDKSAGISASIGKVTSQALGYPYLYVWSTSVPDFNSEVPYSRFAVYAKLKHGGDYSRAAKELRELGYGGGKALTWQHNLNLGAREKPPLDLSRIEMKRTIDGIPVRPFAPPAPPKPPSATDTKRIFKWMSELSAQSVEAKWLWHGYVARRAITLISAHPKAGKTTMLKYLLRAFGGGVDTFLGQQVTAARVLYVTEEDETFWAERRDDLQIGDHVGVISQPFKLKPLMPQWTDFLKKVEDAVYDHGFDLVVFDTMGKLWPVKEENNASEIDGALQPLWNFKDRCDTAVVLVHHLKKSGGDEFTGTRGSSSIAGFMDCLVELQRLRTDDTSSQRLIKATGRFGRDTPERKLIELLADGYHCLGDPDEKQTQATRKHPWHDDLMDVLQEAGEDWSSYDDIADGIASRRGEQPRRNHLVAVLGRLFDGGEIERQGDGKKGNPYMYRMTQ